MSADDLLVMSDFDVEEAIDELSTFVWPPTNAEPTIESGGYYCDGKYSDNLMCVSPEGYVYGKEQRIKFWPHWMWWDGASWVEVEVSGRAASIEDLPPGPRPFGEIWQAHVYDKTSNSYSWKCHFWDATGGIWCPLKWFWIVEDFTDLPNPGFELGEAHLWLERDVKLFWDSFTLRRERHSSLDDDQPLRHLPDGFLNSLQPDARVIYYSPSEIGIEPIKGGSGKVLINLEYVIARRDASVFPTQKSLEWNEGTQTITAIPLALDTEYWIYLANSHSAFVNGGWDYRNRLFLSQTADHNGMLGDSGAGENARLVGKIQTDNTPESEGGPYFLREIDISLISRQVSLPETYREFSDFVLAFADAENIALQKIDGTYGQIYAGGNIQYLGNGYILNRADGWVEWNNNEPRLIRHETPLTPSSRYFCYLAGELDSYNFNDINPETNRPWQAEDEGALGHYDSDKDLRLKLFLSPKEPDHAYLSESWPGYYCRHVGQVSVDAYGKFIPSWDISAIRQTTLNPSWFDGLAEIEITPVSASEVRICRKKGSSGIVMVRGQVVQTYHYDDVSVHRFTTSDLVQAYSEENFQNPLSDLNAVSTYAAQEIHLYLANGRSFWGTYANRLFFSTTAPASGFLSANWPGNCARWICTVKPDIAGQFTGTFIKGTVALSSHSQLFDDEPEKHFPHSDSTITNLTMLSAAGVLFEIQKIHGLPVKLSYVDSTHVKLAAVGNQNAVVVLPDLSTQTITPAGVTLVAAGATGTTYYVYLTPTGLALSTTAPDKTYASMQTLGPHSLLVGWLAFSGINTLSGAWNVWSFSNENGEFSVDITSETTTLSLAGCVVPPGRTAKLHRTGQDAASAWAGNWGFAYGAMTSIAVVTGTAIGRGFWSMGNPGFNVNVTATATATLSHEAISNGIYSSFTLTHSLNIVATNGIGGSEWESFAGKLILTRN